MHHSEGSLLGSFLWLRSSYLESRLNIGVALWLAVAVLNILILLHVWPLGAAV